MTSTKKELTQRVILAAREYGISMVLFRNVVGDRLGVNVTDMECLGLLFHKGLATPSELARYTGLSSGATTAMLDRLERGGLIERRPNPDDRRGTLIVLLQSGVEKVAPWFAFVRQAQNELVASYSERNCNCWRASSRSSRAFTRRGASGCNRRPGHSEGEAMK
jgi:DNA-binding MarR family transcriptional regulator